MKKKLAQEKQETPTKKKGIQVPKLIIAGAQKGGTTALFRILQKLNHFVVNSKVRPGTREAMFFDFYVKNMTQLPGVTDEEFEAFQQNMTGPGLTPRVTQALRKEYAMYWDLRLIPPEKRQTHITFEKTPNYMVAQHAPELIKKVVPWVKIAFIIREPIARVFSHYKHMHSDKKCTKNAEVCKPENFEFYITQEIESLRQQGLTQAPTLEEFNSPGFVLNATSFALPHPIAKRRLLRKSATGMLYKGFYAELLSAWMEHFEWGNTLLVVSNEYFNENQQEVIHQIQKFTGTPKRDQQQKTLEKNYHQAKMTAFMAVSTRQYLEHFYQPYNEELEELMGKEWYNAHAGDAWKPLESKFANVEAIF